MQSIDVLFNEVKINVDSNQPLYFKQIDVDVVNSKWIIQLYAEYLITSDYYSEIQMKLKNHFKGQVKTIIVKLVLKNSHLKNQEHNRVIGHYHHILEQNTELKKIFEITNFGVLDNKLIFDINTSYDQNMIQKELIKLSNELDILGITDYRYDFNVLQEKNTEIVEQRIKEKEVQMKVKTNSSLEKSRVLFGDDIRKKKVHSIEQVLDPNNMLINCTIEGEAFDVEVKQLLKTSLLIIMIRDDSGTIITKKFPGYNGEPPFLKHLESVKKGMRIKISGRKEFDRYLNDEVIMISSLTIMEHKIPITTREDTSVEKRVELHTHTKMSKNNGINSLDDYAQMAQK
ncbi:MAG: hypothetical protein ACRC5R_01445, partial [Mycoplasmatales bacterium]